MSSVADPKLLILDPDATWRVTMDLDPDPDLSWQVISDPDPTLQVVSDPDPCLRNVRQIFIFKVRMNMKTSVL